LLANGRALVFWPATVAGSAIVLTFVYRQSDCVGFYAGNLLQLGAVAAGAIT